MPLQERVGWISAGALNYVGERLTVPPAEIYGVATFYALFRRSHAAPFVATSATTSPVRMPAREALGALGSRVAAVERPSCTHRASGSAIARPPRSLTAGEPRNVTATLRLKRRPRSRTPAPRRPHIGGAPLHPAASRSDASIPRASTTYRAHGGYAALRARSSSARTASSREIDRRQNSSDAAAPPFRPAKRWKRRGRAGAAALSRLQRRRIRAGHVQRPRADGGRSVRACIEAMTIAGHRRRLRARLTSTCAASIRSRRQRLARAIAAARDQRVCSATT